MTPDRARVAGCTAQTLLFCLVAGLGLHCGGGQGAAVAPPQPPATVQAPKIATPPASAKAAVTCEASFQVTVDGTAPFHFQWSRDGVEIPGATSERLVLADLKMEDTGYYRCTVTNSAGSVTSAAASLEVAASIVLPPDIKPFGLMLAGDGRKWIASPQTGLVTVNNPQTGQWARFDWGKDARPTALAVGPDKQVWVSLAGSGELGQIDPQTATQKRHRIGNGPIGLVKGAGNELWCALAGEDKVAKFGMDGAVMGNAVTRGAAPAGIAVAPDGTVWFTEYEAGRIGRLTVQGKVEEFACPHAGAKPEAILVGPDGRVWYADKANGKVVVFQGHEQQAAVRPAWAQSPQASGLQGPAVLELSATGALPVGMAMEQDGKAVWVTESGTGKVSRVSVGQPRMTIAFDSAQGKPTGVVIDAASRVWVAQEEAQTLTQLPSRLTFALPGGMPLELVWVPSGTFRYPAGSTVQNGEVTISQGFYLGRFEVTQAQWQAVMGTNPSLNRGGMLLPVENLSWKDGEAFLQKLNTTLAPPAGMTFRYPTAGEWVWAAGAGNSSRYLWGHDLAAGSEWAWMGTNSGGSTHPVGEKRANNRGLFDVQGNVAEFVADWFGLQGLVGTDPTGPETYDSLPSKMHLGGAVNFEMDLASPTSLMGNYMLPDGYAGLRVFLGRELPAKSVAPAKVLTVQPAGTMAVARTFHSATVLSDGRVLVVGGETDTAQRGRTAEVWDPATRQFSDAGSMTGSSSEHTATLLADGTVLVVGGRSDSGQALSQVHRWDPKTNRFTLQNPLLHARCNGHTATLLPNGKVLIIGGDAMPGVPSGVPEAELYEPDATGGPDPALKGKATATGKLAVPRSLHVARYHTGTNGGVVAVSGGCINGEGGDSTTSQEFYTEATGTFRMGNKPFLSGKRAGAAVVALDADGFGQLVAGGFDYDANAVLATAELTGPWSGSLMSPGTLPEPAVLSQGVRLPDGRALLCGGMDVSMKKALDSLVVFDRRANNGLGAFQKIQPMASPRMNHTVSLLPDGRVLIIGGRTEDRMSANVRTAELVF